MVERNFERGGDGEEGVRTEGRGGDGTGREGREVMREGGEGGEIFYLKVVCGQRERERERASLGNNVQNG